MSDQNKINSLQRRLAELESMLDRCPKDRLGKPVVIGEGGICHIWHVDEDEGTLDHTHNVDADEGVADFGWYYSPISECYTIEQDARDARERAERTIERERAEERLTRDYIDRTVQG